MSLLCCAWLPLDGTEFSFSRSRFAPNTGVNSVTFVLIQSTRVLCRQKSVLTCNVTFYRINMNNNSRAALILQLASEKCNEQNICNQNALKGDDVLMQDLDTSTSEKCENKHYETEDQNIMHTQCISPSIIENIREPFCTDGNTTSDKENVYFEDSGEQC
ncbi:uncharacterized protein isoform X2 [Leptinotarsa decemlineata]|uniref:uncharacterized protein isoform X2 n=1 Tax=Leptinotarsa decemlineata TaxID=7539 RepID=UPI003D30B018